MTAAAADETRATEEWFVTHGLPYFVDDLRAKVRRGLARPRLLRLLVVTSVIGVAVGIGVGWWSDDVGAGLVSGATIAALVLVGYALTVLRTWVIATWAIRRTFGSLGQLFPLVTRALPLLLLFITFLFINAEVWEVASHLDGAVMWLTVALFTAITVAFLLVRLPEELQVFDDQLDADRVVAGCRGTPMEGWAAAHDREAEQVMRQERMAGLQKVNLVLMLLIAQIVQVLLLSFAVFTFFVVFGLLVMEPDIIRNWTGEETLRSVPFFERANMELLQVSVFVAAFSGLYFTVYAVTDEIYRRQFFTSIVHELERAVSVRVAYRALRGQDPG
ncbi:hypothetical protein [Nocardioides sp.]|uniref:hypothetical protein n=1 Tax=Nocardioides sp. TaxID=35761 RepID=UPI002ED12BAF